MQKVRGLVKVTAALSLACGISAAAAAPALAASPNEAYAALATGTIALGPLAEATYPGTSPVNVANADIAGLLTTGIVTDTATATSATSQVANVGVSLAAATALLSAVGLNADAVSSTCSFDPDTDSVSGSATITNGTIAGGLLGTINLDASPTLDENVVGLGSIATITLDHQTTAADGTLTVDAIYVSLLGGAQTLSIGTSVCNTATLAGAPALPRVATPIGASLAGLVGFGGIGYFLNRRRRISAQG
jgi:hypothetical protein